MKVEVIRDSNWDDRWIALQINQDGAMYLRDLRHLLKPVTSIKNAVDYALQSVRQKFHSDFVIYLPDGAAIPEELLALGIEPFELNASTGR